MRFKFSKNLDYQLAAISAVADLFDSGKPRTTSSARADFSLLSPGLVTSNILAITPEQLLSNLQTIQKNNGVEQSAKLSSPDFTIEMETGTGKTYVYLRTILELNARYGLTKFIKL
jgi:type III restriction enzyme